MSDEIGKILLKKYQEKTLASLYIVNYDEQTINPETWVDNFIKEFTPLADHPDILKVFKDEKSNEYKVDSQSIKGFLKFINYRPLQLNKKFIFLFDAQDLSVIVSNKLLKVFEELGSDYCLILLAPDNSSILPTVLSRAIKLKVTGKSDLFASPKIDFKDIKTPQELLAVLKQGGELEKKFIEHAINQCLAQGSYKDLDKLLFDLKDYEVKSAFNNSKLANLSAFFS